MYKYSNCESNWAKSDLWWIIWVVGNDGLRLINKPLAKMDWDK